MTDVRIRQQEIDKIKLSKKQNKKKKRNKVVIAAASFASAATLFLTSCFSLSKKNKVEDTKYISPKNTIENLVDPLTSGNIIDKKINTASLEDLGVKLDFSKDDKKEYSNPSGNIKVDDIVEDEKGTVWVSEEAESKNEEVGKVNIDTKDNTLEIKSDDTVYEKNTGYEIKDEQGNIKEEGNLDSDGLPSGFDHDKDTDKIFDDKHANTGLYVAPDGSVWESEQKFLDSLKEEEITNEETEFIPMDPVIVDESISNTTSGSTSEVTEPSKPTETTKPSTGNYYDKMSGLTFQSKEHYDQWVLQDFEGYGIVNGIMVPKTAEMEKSDQKVLTK